MKCILSCLLILLSQVVCAQNHKAVAFQAVARTNYGVIMPNKQIQVRISILSDTVKNSIVYQEVKLAYFTCEVKGGRLCLAHATNTSESWGRVANALF